MKRENKITSVDIDGLCHGIEICCDGASAEKGILFSFFFVFHLLWSGLRPYQMHPWVPHQHLMCHEGYRIHCLRQHHGLCVLP